MPKVYILVVTNTSGSVILLSAHSSRSSAFAYLADAYCRPSWKEQWGGRRSDLAKDQESAVKEYFDFWSDEMDWQIEERQLDPVNNER